MASAIGMRRIAWFLALLLISVPAWAEKQRQDCLRIEPASADLGVVLEGKTVNYVFILRNVSSQTVHITDVQSSCGCTVATPETHILDAGGFTELKVSVDTSAKTGVVKKWIRITDSRGNEATAWVSLTVRPNPHSKAFKGKGIFDTGCASCHADPAKDLVEGKAIYAAVCAMCHGREAQGAYAPSLRKKHNAVALTRSISHGTGSRHMPGFGRSQGGPLDHEQVEALVKWILSLDSDT